MFPRRTHCKSGECFRHTPRSRVTLTAALPARPSTLHLRDQHGKAVLYSFGCNVPIRRSSGKRTSATRGTNPGRSPPIRRRGDRSPKSVLRDLRSSRPGIARTSPRTCPHNTHHRLDSPSALSSKVSFGTTRNEQTAPPLPCSGSARLPPAPTQATLPPDRISTTRAPRAGTGARLRPRSGFPGSLWTSFDSSRR